MDIFGLFKKKKKPEVKSYPAPKVHIGSNATVGKVLEKSLRKDWKNLHGDIDVTSRRYNAKTLPNKYRRQMGVMESRAR